MSNSATVAGLSLLCICVIAFLASSSTLLYYKNVSDKTTGKWTLVDISTDPSTKEYIIARKGLRNESECMSVAVGCYVTENAKVDGTETQKNKKILADATDQMNNIVKNFPKVSNIGTALNKSPSASQFSVMKCSDFTCTFGRKAGYPDRNSWCSIVRRTVKKPFGPPALNIRL